MNRIQQFIDDNGIDEYYMICAFNPTCFTCPIQFKYADECMNHRNEINSYLREEIKDVNQ